MREAIKGAIWSIDPNQPFYDVTTLDDLVSRSLSQQRFAMVLLTAFAVLAAVLATVGTYGVVAYVATQRRQEIGIRVAMGARPGQVVWAVSRQGIVWIAAGVSIGLALALAGTRVLRTLLHGVTPADPLTFAGGAFLLLVVGFAATVIAARRAARADPVSALRGG
jgi:ABC-type antimicrobial peptide transport system permease subunit